MKKNPNVKYAVVRTGNRSINTLGFLMYKIVYKKLLCSTRRAQQEENEIFSARYKNRKKEFYMEFRDLKQQYQLHKKQIDDAIQGYSQIQISYKDQKCHIWKKCLQNMWE